MDISDYLRFSDPRLVEKLRQNTQVVGYEGAPSTAGYSGEASLDASLLQTKPLKKRKSWLPSGLHFFARSKNECVREYFRKGNYKGKCTPLFDGRVVIGPQKLTVSLSMLVLLLMSLTMALHVCPHLVESVEELDGAVHVTKFFTGLLDYFLLPLSWIFFILTAFSDPGIIPRSNPEDRPEELIAEIRPQQIDQRTGMPRPRYLLLNGVAVKQKWCRTCRIYRPPRSHHCSVCDDCVTRFDHHCAVLGTCVGLGNYRYFLCLIVTLGLASLLALGLCIAHIATAAECRKQKVGYFILDHLNDFLVAIFCVLLVGGFAMLNMYHLYITAHNLSTNEHLKRYYRMNPFDYGTKENYSNICCERGANVLFSSLHRPLFPSGTPDMLLPTVAGGMNILASYRKPYHTSLRS